MNIAILGTRGIPARYGGFETFAQECATRLAARGHRVTVYGRSHYVPRQLRDYRGVRLVVLPTLRWKYTDTVVHTCLSVLHALFRRFDVILICNAANSFLAWLPRVAGTPTVVNVDGIERLRRKWSWVGRGYYHLSEHLSVWLPTLIVTDARVIQEYYRERYRAHSVFIPYGAPTERPAGKDALSSLGLSERGYFLYVSRLEPENNAHRVISAFEKVRSLRRLVIVGDAPYARDYIAEIRATSDPRILFTGAIYGPGYLELQANAFCYVHATEVGGSHPALLEAMGQGSLIVSNRTPENAEVLGDAGLFYPKNDDDALVRVLQDVEDRPAIFEDLRTAAAERARSLYSWDSVVDQYEQLFRRLAAS